MSPPLSFLSLDEDTISSFIADFLLKGLLPHMERKLISLSEQVAAARKGFRNQVRLFFGKRGVRAPPRLFACFSRYLQVAHLIYNPLDHKIAQKKAATAPHYEVGRTGKKWAGGKGGLGRRVGVWEGR